MVNSHAELDRSFLALSHAVRRSIVERLVSGPATVGEASSGVDATKPSVTKHVKVLEEAGVVSRTVNGRRHVLRLEPRALREASNWLELHRSLWQSKFETVERHLAESGLRRLPGSAAAGTAGVHVVLGGGSRTPSWRAARTRSS